jgi:hypothetical protein
LLKNGVQAADPETAANYSTNLENVGNDQKEHLQHRRSGDSASQWPTHLQWRLPPRQRLRRAVRGLPAPVKPRSLRRRLTISRRCPKALYIDSATASSIGSLMAKALSGIPADALPLYRAAKPMFAGVPVSPHQRLRSPSSLRRAEPQPYGVKGTLAEEQGRRLSIRTAGCRRITPPTTCRRRRRYQLRGRRQPVEHDGGRHRSWMNALSAGVD